MKKNNEHPEVADIKNICDVLPKNEMTKSICEKVNKERTLSSNQKKPNNKKKGLQDK